MKIFENIDLYKYSTMRLHSTAEKMYVPQSKDELKVLVEELADNKTQYSILSAGSNIVFAEKVRTPLINLMELDDDITYTGELVRVGCSVRIQRLIRDLQKHSQGGIEYLYSVPSSAGGAVYMNAGRGKSQGMAISDYLEEVEYFDPSDRQFHVYKKLAADFSHRHSPFQGSNNIIVSATFRFRRQTQEETEERIKERMEHSRKYLSADKPSCGSVFCEGNRIVYRLLMGQRIGGAMYSKKTPDWISNVGDATASDVMALIRRGIWWHKLFLSRCKVEIRYIQ